MARTPPPVPAPPTVLVLLRHGDAGDALAAADRDALRPLTAKGRKQSRRAGRALVSLGLLPRDVWTSRLARALETADVAVTAVPREVRRVATAALAPDATPERIVRALHETPAPAETPAPDARPARRRASRPSSPAPVVRWVVGHDPHLSRLFAFLTGTPVAALHLPKGAFAVLETDGRGPVEAGAKVRLLLPPDALKALRH